jgi:hypothetical protein
MELEGQCSYMGGLMLLTIYISGGSSSINCIYFSQIYVFVLIQFETAFVWAQHLLSTTGYDVLLLATCMYRIQR